MASFKNETPILIKTKLNQPRLGQDLIPRPQLVEQLNQGLDCKLTLISAQAGAGKTTLLAQWLQGHSRQSAWLSLDEEDNNLMVFVSYLCSAIRKVFPDACEEALNLLDAPVRPPTRTITTLLINELDELCNRKQTFGNEQDGNIGLIITLDDYHLIKEAAIHEFISKLIAYLPDCVHLAIATRTDPPLPLAGLRSHREMNELRTQDLQMSAEEAGKLLEVTAGRRLNDETIRLLRDKTEGWAVGLRFAALSIRDLPQDRDFAANLKNTGSAYFVDYLTSEVLSQQPAAHRDFLLRSSILNRFNADLCDAVLYVEDDGSTAASRPGDGHSRTILGDLKTANLFLIQLDQEGRWFRFHHLFRDLLLQRLQNQVDRDYIATLHIRASQWFEEDGFIDEALNHAFSAGYLEGAAKIVARQRYSLMNQARWQRLDRYLRRFPPEFANKHPDLLILNCWLVYHQGHFGQLPALVAQLEASMAQTTLPPKTINNLESEISGLKSLITYFQFDEAGTIAAAEFCIKNTPPELWIVRIHARLYLAGAYQMRGELGRAYDTYYRGLDEESVQSNRFKATLLMAGCNLHWIAADLGRMEGAAKQCIALCDFPHSVEIKGYGDYHLGQVFYQRNDMAAAKNHFTSVVKQPNLNYGLSFAGSAFCLGLIYQAQNRFDEAGETASLVVAHMVATGNMTLLPVALAFQAEIALRQGQLAAAEQWASQFESYPPIIPLFKMYEPHYTLVKIWLAQDTGASRGKAAEFLDQLRKYAESAHNVFCLIQTLALQAVLQTMEDNEEAALTSLAKAVELAEPGGFIRVFVDLGAPMAALLAALNTQRVSSDYIGQILSAFPPEAKEAEAPSPTATSPDPASLLAEPLTPREMAVLELLAQRLTNKEIADELVVSPATVKTHTLSIYGKLDVHSRQEAVEKAGRLSLLTPTLRA